MKVKAIKLGFLDKLRHPGDEFECNKDQLGSWMEVLEEEKPKKTRRKKSKPAIEVTPDEAETDSQEVKTETEAEA